MLTPVVPGEIEVFRIARRSTTPFAPPDWRWAIPGDGTFGGRFDDPRGRDGLPEDQRFRVIYCASRRVTAFAETLAHLRTPIGRLAGLMPGIDDEGRTVDQSVAATFAGTFDPDDPSRAVVSREWRARRQVGRVTLDAGLTFADITTAASFRALRHAVADTALSLGLSDLDLSVITGPQRQLTQACSLYIHELADASGRHLFDGIRYASHLDAGWECWAIFDDRLAGHGEISELVILPDDPDLLEVARHFDLSIEIAKDHYLRPAWHG